MHRTNLFFKVVIEHDDEDQPERLGREICRQLMKVYGVRVGGAGELHARGGVGAATIYSGSAPLNMRMVFRNAFSSGHLFADMARSLPRRIRPASRGLE
jgi:hypothetical protein